MSGSGSPDIGLTRLKHRAQCSELIQMKVNKGQYLYRQGDASDSLFIIKAGKVGLFVGSVRGPTEVGRIGSGQIVGDLNYFTGQPRSSDAVAITDVECIQVDYAMVKMQFDLSPPWIQLMTKTLAAQVQSFSNEIKPLRDHEDGAGMSRLIIARAWAALALVPTQYGVRNGNEITIDWPTLRSLSNLCFREISDRVLQLAKALQPAGYCSVEGDTTGPLSVTLKQPKIFNEFLSFYTRAITKNSPELTMIQPIEYDTLMVLANPKITTTPIHRGQVEIDLMAFKRFAASTGHPEITATSVDLLTTFGLDISKNSTDSGVRLRFHQEEVTTRAKLWHILRILQEMNQTVKLPNAG